MIDSLETAIKHCEEVAEEQDMKAGFETDNQTYTMSEAERERYKECASEHRQLAEWLRELKRWREFAHKNAQCINDCLIQNRIDELYSSEIKNDADRLRIVNEALTLRTTNEFCKSFNERYEREGSDSE